MFGTHLIPVTRTEEEEKKKKEEGGRRRGCGNVANRQRFGRGQPANFMLRTEMIKDIYIYTYSPGRPSTSQTKLILKAAFTTSSCQLPQGGSGRTNDRSPLVRGNCVGRQFVLALESGTQRQRGPGHQRGNIRSQWPRPSHPTCISVHHVPAQGLPPSLFDQHGQKRGTSLKRPFGVGQNGILQQFRGREV